ncbi:hypothetical protein GCM10027067_37490 [Pseudactinotalea suaedae]
MAVPVGMPDHALLTRARDGDGEAFEALYRRHHRAATRAAHSYSSRTQLAEDAVQEAFMRILQATQDGGGPKTEFRAYLATTVRHVIAGWTRGEQTILTDKLEELAGEDTRDSHRPESRLRWHLLTKAFKSLPTRWQEALWLGEVEGVAPAELADRWNMSANSAAALSYRAREGLRTAWLDAHVNEGLVPDECRPFVTDLSRYTQGKLTDRREAQVRSHLEDCDYCRGVLFEVDTAASELRVLLIPVAVWAGLALAGGGVAGGTLAGLSKMAAGVSTRSMALGATSTAAVTAIVIATVTMNPGAADAFGNDPGGARPLVTLGLPGGSGPDDDGAGADADEASEDPSEDPSDEPTDGPSDDPTAVPTPGPDDTTTAQRTTIRDDPPSSPDQTPDPDPTPSSDPAVSPAPTTPPTIPPVVPPTDEPDEAAAPGLDFDVVEGVIVLFGRGEPGATITLETVPVAGGGGGDAAGGAVRSVPLRMPTEVTGTPLDTVEVDPDGDWTLTPELDLVAGQRVSAIQTTVDGRVSAAVTVDLPSRPAAPEITFSDRVGQYVTIRGQIEAGGDIEIDTSDGTRVTDLVLLQDGTWSANIDLLTSGGGEITARQWFDDLPSQVSAYPIPEFVLVDLILSVPVVDGDVIRFSGTGEPGASVTVSGEGFETDPVSVNQNGEWSSSVPADHALSDTPVVATQTLGDRTSVSEAASIPFIAPPLQIDTVVFLNGVLTVTGTTSESGTVVVRFVEEGPDREIGAVISLGELWVLIAVDPRIQPDSEIEAVLVVDGVESDPVPVDW